MASLIELSELNLTFFSLFLISSSILSTLFFPFFGFTVLGFFVFFPKKVFWPSLELSLGFFTLVKFSIFSTFESSTFFIGVMLNSDFFFVYLMSSFELPEEFR